MSTFKQYLHELLDSKVDGLKQLVDERDRQTWSLHVNGRELIFFSNWFGTNCDFAFKERGTPTYDISGNGGEFIVFSAVKQILSTLIAEREPDLITLEASKVEGNGRTSISREKLYRRMLKKWTPNGYHLHEYGDGFSTFFQLVKKVEPVKFKINLDR